MDAQSILLDPVFQAPDTIRSPSLESESAHAGAKLEVPKEFGRRSIPMAPTQEVNQENNDEEHHRHHCPECWDLLMKALTLRTGELPYPVRALEISLDSEQDDRGMPGVTGMRFLQRSVQRVTRMEGESLIHWMKWWLASFISLIMLVLLTSHVTVKYWTKLIGLHNVYGLGIGVSILICSVVAYSLGRLVQKLASYGWRRSSRVLWVRLSQRESMRTWREGVHSQSVYGQSRRVPW